MTSALTARRAILAPGGWVRNDLWRCARAVPSLDLRFAESKSLVDAASGQSLVTFTRASSGTYVGSDGLIKTATTNLLLQSQTFSTTWTPVAVTFAENVTTAPDGTNTADAIIEDTQTTTHNASQNVSLTTGTTYTYSCFVKASQRSFCFLVVNGPSTLHAISVNLLTGSATTAIGSPTNIVSFSVGNGWYRCSFTYGSAVTGNAAHEVRLSTDGVWANRFYTGDGTGSVYAWGAQLEQSSTVGEYIPTTSTINSAPRFDHNPTTGESLGLLVEEQRTNLLLNSAKPDSFTSSSSTTPAPLSNQGTAPDGSDSAWMLAANATGFCQRNYTIPSSVATYTWSIYVKAVDLTATRIVSFVQVGVFTPDMQSITFNLNTLSLTGATNGTVTNAGNGWYRISSAFQNNNTSTLFVNRINSDSIGSTNINGKVLFWGAQLEAGAFPTSYIPTTTAAVTRSADVASITGSNFSSWYRQDEGTLYAGIRSVGTTGLKFHGVFLYSAADSGIISVSHDSAAAKAQVLTDGFVSQASFTLSMTQPQTIAIGYATDNVAASSFGTLSGPDTSAALPTANKLRLGWNNVNNQGAAGHLSRVVFWPQRLSNSTLQAITQ